MNEHDTMVVRALRESYRLQTGYYARMCDTVQRILSRLILGRGDLLGVKDAFVEKQTLLANIEAERVKMTPYISAWQERKSSIAGDPEAQDLDTELRKTEKTIKEFLEGEEQLKKHIERMIRKGK